MNPITYIRDAYCRFEVRRIEARAAARAKLDAEEARRKEELEAKRKQLVAELTRVRAAFEKLGFEFATATTGEDDNSEASCFGRWPGGELHCLTVNHRGGYVIKRIGSTK